MPISPGGAYSFPEAFLYAWTGVKQPADAIALLRDVSVVPFHEYENVQAVNGNYFNILRGKRVDVTFSVDFYVDTAIDLWAMFESRPSSGVHLNLQNISETPGHVAGIRTWSGQISSPAVAGGEYSMMRTQVSYFANQWEYYSR